MTRSRVPLDGRRVLGRVYAVGGRKHWSRMGCVPRSEGLTYPQMSPGVTGSKTASARNFRCRVRVLGTVRSSQVVAPKGTRKRKTGDRAVFGEQGAGAGSGVEGHWTKLEDRWKRVCMQRRTHPTSMRIIIMPDPRDGIEQQQGLQGSDHGQSQFQISGTCPRERGSPKLYCAQ